MTLLGSRQAVRHMVLVHAFGGSIPSSPARKKSPSLAAFYFDEIETGIFLTNFSKFIRVHLATQQWEVAMTDESYEITVDIKDIPDDVLVEVPYKGLILDRRRRGLHTVTYRLVHMPPGTMALTGLEQISKQPDGPTSVALLRALAAQNKVEGVLCLCGDVSSDRYFHGATPWWPNDPRSALHQCMSFGGQIMLRFAPAGRRSTKDMHVVDIIRVEPVSDTEKSNV